MCALGVYEVGFRFAVDAPKPLPAAPQCGAVVPGRFFKKLQPRLLLGAQSAAIHTVKICLPFPRSFLGGGNAAWPTASLHGPPHDCYVEVFAGGAARYFCEPRSRRLRCSTTSTATRSCCTVGAELSGRIGAPNGRSVRARSSNGRRCPPGNPHPPPARHSFSTCNILPSPARS